MMKKLLPKTYIKILECYCGKTGNPYIPGNKHKGLTAHVLSNRRDGAYNVRIKNDNEHCIALEVRVISKPPRAPKVKPVVVEELPKPEKKSLIKRLLHF